MIRLKLLSNAEIVQADHDGVLTFEVWYAGETRRATIQVKDQKAWDNKWDNIEVELSTGIESDA